MNRRRAPTAAWLAMAVAAVAAPTSAHAAESCTGYIDSLPAVIAASGVWCLAADLDTAQASGAAILIAVDNTVVDCNGFMVRNTAGTATQAYGIRSVGNATATVRDCVVDGFSVGISLEAGGHDHRVADNRVGHSRRTGIWVDGDGSQVVDNVVALTGSPGGFPGTVIGIRTFGTVDIVDNNVHDLLPTDDAGSNRVSYGIAINDAVGAAIRGNMVSTGYGRNGVKSAGLRLFGTALDVRDNQVTQFDTGIVCSDASSQLDGNTVMLVGTRWIKCAPTLDNWELDAVP